MDKLGVALGILDRGVRTDRPWSKGVAYAEQCGRLRCTTRRNKRVRSTDPAEGEVAVDGEAGIRGRDTAVEEIKPIVFQAARRGAATRQAIHGRVRGEVGWAGLNATTRDLCLPGGDPNAIALQ